MNLQYSELSNEKNEAVKGPILIKPKIFGDDRGFFYESWNRNNWCEILKSNHQNLPKVFLGVYIIKQILIPKEN